MGSRPSKINAPGIHRHSSISDNNNRVSNGIVTQPCNSDLKMSQRTETSDKSSKIFQNDDNKSREITTDDNPERNNSQSTNINNNDTNVADSSNSQLSEMHKDGLGQSADNTDNETEKPKSNKLPPLTDEEADEKRVFLFLKLEELTSTINGVKLIQDKSVSPETLPALKGLANTYRGLNRASLKKRVDFRKDVAKHFIDTGVSDKLCDIVVHLHKKGYKDSKDDWLPFYYCLLDLMNYTDSNSLLTVSCVAHPTFLTCVRESLVSISKAFPEAEDGPDTAQEATTDSKQMKPQKMKKPKVKKKKEKDQPKRPQSAFFIWLGEHRENIEKDNSNFSIADTAKKAAEMWKAMEDKSEWLKKAEDAKENYIEAMEEWKKKKAAEKSDDEGESVDEKSKKSANTDSDSSCDESDKSMEMKKREDSEIEWSEKKYLTNLKLHLGVIHNIAMQDIDENVRRLREENYTEVLLPYLKSKNELVVLNAISTLAEIVDEKESELLQVGNNSIHFLVKRLEMAMRSKTRRALGWSCHEIARAIGRLARNDKNKKTLADCGSIPLLLELSRSEADTKEQEIKDAVHAIWALSFDEHNKKTIVDTEGLIDRILELNKHSLKPVKHACNGILWTLRDTLKETEYCDIIKKLFPTDLKSPAHSSSILNIYKQGHVMISYQWANQNILLDVRNRLKAEKIPVWMDVDDMGGSTLQAMAEAIENAHLVLICMSQKYKDSPNCRAEAEYAFQKRKLIVPLIMEKRYRPDGWLGMILGSKLFYDFSGKYPFETKIGGLLKEVEKSYIPSVSGDSSDGVFSETKQEEGKIEPETGSVSSAPPPAKKSEEKVKKWTEGEVRKWTQEHNIKSINLNEIAGEELVSIRNVQFKAPEFFYRILQEKLELSSVRDLFRFENALNHLFS